MELTGRTLGHYRVLEEISRGGMGVVYRATDTRLNRDVALKVLPDDLTNDPDRRRRFLKEAQAASSLEHPHIAVIHEADEVDGLAFIAMELIRGEKLSDLLARQRPSPARSLELGAEVAAGLARAHEKGIVHRDLKPANVMVTDEGHAKIIDFGIAKLIEASAIAGAPTQTGRDTGVGVVLGTMTYMSPEQARGDTVDHRSDIFSFGILLHEMLAGQPPFRGKTGIETASAILHEPAPRLPSLGPGVAGDASADIQRIVDKCLAKDPADRYQGMKDLVVDIRTARRHLDTAPQAAAVSTPIAGRLPAWAWLAAGAVVIAVAAGWVLMRPQTTGTDAAGGRSGKPSVAVLYFDNTTGDKELDWMRTGITEMVVTDLSQSQEIEVVGTDRLYGILAELKRQDDRVLSPDVISAVAERTGVDRVIVGSYVKSGEAIRINVRLQDAKTGRIESSERVEGANASALFSMIDDLSRRIRSKFEGLKADAKLLTAPGTADPSGLDRGLGDVTTSSIEAYRLYAEGINLHNRFREQEASEMFAKAIAIDPLFAMAYVKLGVTENNLGRNAVGSKYAAQALKLADRLTPRERFYIEGYTYSGRRATLPRAIDAYKKCIDIDPGHQACRHNLGFIYNALERYPEGAIQYEELMRRGSTNPAAYSNLSAAYRAMGEGEKSRSVVESFVKRNPENAAGHAALGAALIGLGRHEEAIRELSQANLLGSDNPGTDNARAVAQTMREDWDAAAGISKALYASSDEPRKGLGAASQYMLSLFHGRSAEALTWAERASSAFKVPGGQSSQGHRLAATALLARGQTALAAAASAKAVADAKGTNAEPAALVIHAWTLAAAGRHTDADAAIATLAAGVDPVSVSRDQRNVAWARGLAALARGDSAAAITALQEAQAALSLRGGNISFATPHVLIWSSLGRALFESGRAGDALPWFQKVAGSGYEHAREPIEFVRSFYFLGRIYEQQGDITKAREAYRRFVGYWKDGDLDRDRIAEAQRKIAG
jgi:tetratricopeptide (TPR) repeat protein/TolB-like protein/predicted Ser/Thr protein kinase